MEGSLEGSGAIQPAPRSIPAKPKGSCRNYAAVARVVAPAMV